MFDFFSKKKKPLHDFSRLQADLHSHLLPGIDDGAVDLQESLLMLQSLQEMGYRKVITTPHVYSAYFPNKTAEINEAEKVVQDALQAEGSALEFRAAAEYFCDEELRRRIAADDLLTLDGKRVLIETGFMEPNRLLHEVVFQLKLREYQPVLAHPERYPYLAKDPSLSARYREWGCEFQVNLGSVTGLYGRKAQKLARELIRKGWVEFLGTDLHRPMQLNELYMGMQSAEVQNLLEKEWKNREL